MFIQNKSYLHLGKIKTLKATKKNNENFITSASVDESKLVGIISTLLRETDPAMISSLLTEIEKRDYSKKEVEIFDLNRFYSHFTHLLLRVVSERDSGESNCEELKECIVKALRISIEEEIYDKNEFEIN